MMRGIKIEQREVAGESVWIRSLSGGKNAARVIELCQTVGGVKGAAMVELGTLLVAECLCSDETGKREFASPEDAADNCSLGFIVAFCEPALDVSGLHDDAEEVAKNSVAAP